MGILLRSHRLDGFHLDFDNSHSCMPAQGHIAKFHMLDLGSNCFHSHILALDLVMGRILDLGQSFVHWHSMELSALCMSGHIHQCLMWSAVDYLHSDGVHANFVVEELIFKVVWRQDWCANDWCNRRHIFIGLSTNIFCKLDWYLFTLAEVESNEIPVICFLHELNRLLS